MNRLERRVLILNQINKGRCPCVDDLCRMCECSERTILDDIKFLRENLGYSIEFDRFRGGYINETKDQQLPQFELDAGELLALTLGKDMLTTYGGTTFEPLLQNALDKIAERLPKSITVRLSDLVGVVRFKSTGPAPVSRRTFFALNDACDEHRVVKLVYASASTGQTTFRDIEPLALVENRGAWYCIAWCRLRNQVRMFALHRITEYQVLNEEFAARPDVDVDEYLSEAFLLEHGDPTQRYVVKFGPPASRLIRERTWHPSQELIEHKDGSCTLSFTATNLDEVKRWVLTFGAAAEALSPPALRKALLGDVEQMHRLYEQVSNGNVRPAKKKQIAATKPKEPRTKTTRLQE